MGLDLNIKKKTFIVFIVIILLMMLVLLCERNVTTLKKQEVLNYKTYTLLKVSELKNGDIMFRRAYGVESNIAVNFSDGEKKYSHAGIVVIEGDNVSVIHSLDDRKLHYNGVVKESLVTFLQDIDIWAVYRYELSITLRDNIAKKALVFKNMNIKFDNQFDLSTDDKMYCSEFIMKIVNLSTGMETIKAKKMLMGRKFVTISNLYENKISKLLFSDASL
ncbi:hypothetical protein KJ877_09890, partial [bacterium]|nr:hypothetical protein [bacterium]MBU1991255.1 hypothetical protein [bacterium]